jgi:trans-2,3-dihydro-3-hydroxyanthranilate isomerase
VRRRFVTLDVFTDRRFGGNPLAVVLDGEQLDTTAMQAIAREFNLSETVFVLKPATAAHRARLRIFTPTVELPFAGHPTVGTAVLLARLDGGTATRELVLEEGIGPVRCTVEPNDGDGGRAQFTIPRLPEHVGEAADAADLAAALGLALDDLGCEDYEPGRWSAGIPFVMVPVRGLEAIGRARPDPAHWEAAFGAVGHRSVFLFCRETVEPDSYLHARMFAPAMGMSEDPATGSAAAAFAGLTARHGGLADGEHMLSIEQGYEMGRRSLLRLSLTLRAGALAAASIGGDAVLVTEGTIEA